MPENDQAPETLPLSADGSGNQGATCNGRRAGTHRSDSQHTERSRARTLLELMRRADRTNQVRYSSRKLAEATKQSRRNIREALDALAERGLISSDGGRVTRASTYQLAFTTTAVLPLPGAAGAPPTANRRRYSSATLALKQRHSGAGATPPPGAAGAPPLNRERASPATKKVDANMLRINNRLFPQPQFLTGHESSACGSECEAARPTTASADHRTAHSGAATYSPPIQRRQMRTAS